MTLDVARCRLTSQQLLGATATEPADVVQHLVAVQAQDYADAKWALGLRSTGVTEDRVERALADGHILRTHLLRPTWHFVTPADIRWLLVLTAPRVKAVNAHMYRKVGLDAPSFRRSNRAIAKALQGGHFLTRDELRDALTRAGIDTDGDQRLVYMLMHAELDGIICSGPRRGKQFTYAMLEERVPPARIRTQDEALAELAYRYFVSRGPATVNDMAKWSGLTLTDVRKGVGAVRHRLVSEVVGERTFWLSPSTTVARASRGPTVHLLSIFDEYVSAYKDRSAMADEETRARLSAVGNALTHIVVIGGTVAGRWKPRVERRTVVVTLDLFRRLTPAEDGAVDAAVARYGRFAQTPVRLER